MSTYSKRQINQILKRCKNSVHEDKFGRKAKRALQVKQFRKELKNFYLFGN